MTSVVRDRWIRGVTAAMFVALSVGQHDWFLLAVAAMWFGQMVYLWNRPSVYRKTKLFSKNPDDY